jgi:hypothetical protein
MSKMAVSMLAEAALRACCGDAGPFGTSTTGEKQEAKVDPKFKRNFLNKDMKFELSEWKKLPPKARKACEELGYNAEKWDNSEDIDATWKSWWDLTEDEKKNLEILGWEETAWEYQYQWTEWKDLPKLQKKAAKVAGYTEDNWQEWVEGLDTWWEDLGKDEKEAMCVMGWTQSTWDDS